MNQQYPQQPQPGWGTPPPQPPKRNVGKTLGIIAAAFVAVLVIGAVASSGDTDSSNNASSSATSSSPAAVDKDAAAAPAVEEAPSEPEPAADAPVKITAKKTAFTPSILADGKNYTSVKVTVTNNSDDKINVNPLYFEITDSNGTKHSAELAVDEHQIDTVDLAPGENVSGTITGKGKFTATYVTYTDWFEDPVRVAVS